MPSECEQEVTAPLQAASSGSVTLRLTYVPAAHSRCTLDRFCRVHMVPFGLRHALLSSLMRRYFPDAEWS
jgi:hypothetical protein